MHLMLDPITVTKSPASKDSSPRKGQSTPPWRTIETKLVNPIADDLYRDDPYRYEGDLDASRECTGDDLRRIDYIPTPAEIAGTCAKIRASWTKYEKRRRFVGELPPEAFDDAMWTPPVIDMSHFRADAGKSADAV